MQSLSGLGVGVGVWQAFFSTAGSWPESHRGPRSVPHDSIAIPTSCLLFLRAWLLTMQCLGLPRRCLFAMIVAVTSWSSADPREITHVDGQSLRARLPVCHAGRRTTAARGTKQKIKGEGRGLHPSLHATSLGDQDTGHAMQLVVDVAAWSLDFSSATEENLQGPVQSQSQTGA